MRSLYPNAPLLIASLDFFSCWSTQEVRDLIRELDPRNTLILDYTPDSCDELNCFRNWNLPGNFPWFFAIFQAVESNTEIRGNYDMFWKGVFRRRKERHVQRIRPLAGKLPYGHAHARIWFDLSDSVNFCSRRRIHSA